MQKNISHTVSVTLCLLLGMGSAESAQRALIIGNNAYPKLPAQQQLERAINDARVVADTLRGLNYEVALHENLTRSAFNDVWQNLMDQTTPEDTFLLYFAGHGVEIR